MPVTSNASMIPLEPPRLFQTRPLLQAGDLGKRYGRVVAVAGVDLEVYPGEVLGIVGESGSGKSTVLGLLNLFDLDRFQRSKVRIQHIGIVYQHPHLGLRMQNTSSGNVAERLILAGERSFGALRLAARESLAASEFPLDRLDDLPARLSGGMQQRVQLAKAIALRPAVLLLDEPTTGLDVSIQALVLDTLKRLQRELAIATIVVSHDLGIIRTLADRVMVMRHGQVVERGLTDQVLEDPQNAYTQQLVHAKL